MRVYHESEGDMAAHGSTWQHMKEMVSHQSEGDIERDIKDIERDIKKGEGNETDMTSGVMRHAMAMP